MNKRLPDVCRIQYGYAFDSAKFSADEGVPLVRIRDVVRGYSETYTIEECSEDYLVNDGDMLIGMDGEFNIAHWNGGRAYLNQRVCRLIPTDEIDPLYLYYFMPKALKAIEDKTPFVTVKHLSAKELNKIVVPLPAMGQQRMIAARLRKVDELIDWRKEQLAKLDELVKARFVEMFGDPVHNSQHFPTKTLAELGSLDRGRSKHRPRNDPALLGGPYPLIQTGEVTNAGLFITSYHNTYSELGLQQSKMWKAGTLCITIAANIAQTAILTFDACFPDSVVGFLPSGEIHPIYMHYWFGFFQKILDEQAPQVAQKNINLKILSELEVMVPSLEMQERFVSFVEQTNKSKLTIQASLDKLEVMKKALMQEYFG